VSGFLFVGKAGRFSPRRPLRAARFLTAGTRLPEALARHPHLPASPSDRERGRGSDAGAARAGRRDRGATRAVRRGGRPARPEGALGRAGRPQARRRARRGAHDRGCSSIQPPGPRIGTGGRTCSRPTSPQPLPRALTGSRRAPEVPSRQLRNLHVALMCLGGGVRFSLHVGLEIAPHQRNKRDRLCH